MGSANKKKVQGWEKRLLDAVQRKKTAESIETVKTLLSRLNKAGVQFGFAVEAGKKYLQTAT